MMSKFQLVILKEAQDLSLKINELDNYANNPMHSTILVVNYKYKSLDKRKKYTNQLKNLVLFSNQKKCMKIKFQIGFQIN